MGKIIEHDLLPKQKPRKSNLKVKVDLYNYATELYNELSKIGIIQRLKNTPQLGVIRVPKNLRKSRFDYTVLQLYFHQLIKKNLQTKLELTYNNPVKGKEFGDNMQYISEKETPTVGDMLQILTIAYNLGHFYNTFTASRAVVMLAEENVDFRNKLLNSSNSHRFRAAAESLLSEQNYHRLHLLNSLLVLERCDQSKQSVILAQELIYAYLNENSISDSSKLHFIFKVFRSVRNVSYIAYDLQIANMPITIDLCNKESVLILFHELLSIYNDQLPANRLITSIGKMLDDTVYNENSNAICYYRISRKIVNTLSKDESIKYKEYYSDFWLCSKSIFNKQHRQTRDYSPDAILKLTFTAEDKKLSQGLLLELERINNSRVGYYDRNSGERTILVSIKKNCQNKALTSFRVLKSTIKYLRRVAHPSNADIRYLLASKFFLYYLFGENPVVIKATVDPEICVLCTRGKRQRTAEIKSLLAKGNGNTDERHEVEFMLDCLIQDDINDTSITIPSSILIYQKDLPGKKLSEFDGMVIHPMRKSEQIMLLEAKNTDSNPSYAKKCLSDKLDKLNFDYNKDAIKIHNYDALLKVSI